MPRKPFIDRPKRVEVQVPESILSKIQLELFSEIEGRVPHGKMSELVSALMKEWLQSRGVTI